MESELESDKQLFQNSIKYLHSISNMKSLNVPALKSFYSTKGRLMELRNAVYLPSHMTRTSARCQRCFIHLLDGPASYTIKSEQKKSKFAKKVLAKFRRDKPLTQFQRKYLKNLDDFNGNQLAITCKFCNKKSLIKLQKPNKPIRPKVTNNLYQKKKKTKKRDKFCGLNKEAVQSLAPQIRNSDNAGTINKNNKNMSIFKLNSKERLRRKKQKKVQVTKETIKENAMKLKQKTKKLGKLSQFLNSVDTSKTKSTTKLKHFLQSL